MVIASGETTKEEALKSKEVPGRAQASLIVVVLNGLQPNANKYYLYNLYSE